MEFTIYRVHAERKVTSWDIDNIPYDDYEEVLNDLFSSKLEAIRKAQQLFDRGKADWVRVSKMIVAEKGVRIVNKKIYNKFRK